MSSRKEVRPSSNKQDRRSEPHRQTVFTDVYEDEPADILPEGVVAKARNAICQNKTFEPRNGSRLYTELTFPAISGRTGYSLSKSGYIVTSLSGNIFSQADVSYLIGWDNGRYDEITYYISPTQVRVRDNDANSGTACFIQGRINLWEWHSKQEVWIFQIGRMFYTADRDITSLTQVLIFSRSIPNNAFSDGKEFDNDYIVENSGGEFKILLNRNPPIAYRTNTDIPTDKIISNQSDGDKNHKYRYFYSCAFLENFGNFRSRATPVKIQTESGINQYNFENVDEGDWSIINTELPVGRGVTTYGVLDGGAGIDVNPATWAAITDATIRVSINNLGYVNCVFDFSTAVTMDNVASIMQTSIRRYFPNATVEYIGTGTFPRIRITSGKIEGGTVSLCFEGQGGTPSAATMFLTQATGAVVTAPYLDAPNVVRGLTVPLWLGNSDTWQWHWSHFPVYRSPDYGPSGVHLKTDGKQTVNSPDFIVWVKDLRIAASFIARRYNGMVEVWPGEYGEFEEADGGAVIEFEDGSRVELIAGGFIDSKNWRYRGTDESDYYGDNTGWMAAMIGNGRVARVDKVGTLVTRYPGSTGTAFTSDDERKPVWWPNGSMSFIREVIDSDSFTVWDTVDWDMTGVTLEPTYRNFTDLTNDDVLYGNSAYWTAKNRLFTPTPIANLISKQPGYLLTAPWGGKEISYMQLELSYRQFVGYHNYEFQRIILEDKIFALHDFPNRYSALCQSSIHTGTTRDGIELTIPGTLQLIFQLADPEKVADFGIANKGSIFKVSKGVIRMVTNLNEVMDFDGINYEPDLTTTPDGLKKFRDAVRDAVQSFSTIYSRLTGFLMWMVER